MIFKRKLVIKNNLKWLKKWKCKIMLILIIIIMLIIVIIIITIIAILLRDKDS